MKKKKARRGRAGRSGRAADSIKINIEVPMPAAHASDVQHVDVSNEADRALNRMMKRRPR